RPDPRELRHDERAARQRQGDDDDDRGRSDDEARQRQRRLDRVRPETVHRRLERLAREHGGYLPRAVVTRRPSESGTAPGRSTVSFSCRPPAISTSFNPIKPTETSRRRARPSSRRQAKRRLPSRWSAARGIVSPPCFSPTTICTLTEALGGRDSGLSEISPMTSPPSR